MARITGAPEPHFVKRPPSPKDLRTKLSLCIPNGTRLSTSKLIVLVVIIMTIVGLRVLSTVYILFVTSNHQIFFSKIFICFLFLLIGGNKLVV